MKHAELKEGTLRAYLDGEIDSEQVSAVDQHLKSCTACQGELATLRDRVVCVRDGLDRLPESSGAENSATAWAVFQKKREDWMDTGAELVDLGKEIIPRRRRAWHRRSCSSLDGGAGSGVGGEPAGDLPRRALHRTRDRPFHPEEQWATKQPAA